MNHYNYEVIEASFHKQIADYKNDAQRIPERNDSDAEILRFAEKLYETQYKKVLHFTVLNRYKSNNY